MAGLLSLGHLYNEKCYRGSYQVFYSPNMHILLAARNTQQKLCRQQVMNILITNAVIRDVIIAAQRWRRPQQPQADRAASVCTGAQPRKVDSRTQSVGVPSGDWPSLAALPTTPYHRRHGQCSLQSPNNALESQIFNLPGRTFLFNLFFLVIQSIYFRTYNLTVCTCFTVSPCVQHSFFFPKIKKKIRIYNFFQKFKFFQNFLENFEFLEIFNFFGKF